MVEYVTSIAARARGMLERPGWLVIAWLFAGAPVADLVGEDRVAVYGETCVRFAPLAEAKSILLAHDRFLSNLSRFDVQSRLRTDQAVTPRDLAVFAAQNAAAWEPDEVVKLTAIVETIAGKLAPYKLPFPDTVLLIKTTGKEEGGAAYCRQHAVVLPQSYVDAAAARIEATLIHELFHILSSANPGWRKGLYELVGFRPCPAVALPAMLVDRKITNPDAPALDVYVELDDEDQKRLAVPVLYSSVPVYDPQQGGSFFKYLAFRLMVVQQVGDDWRPAEVDGQPVLLDPANVASYHRQIGRNTRTIIHPEEILAENFTHMIRGTDNLPTPELIERLRRRLEVR